MLNHAQVLSAVSLNRYYGQFLAWTESGRPKSGWVERLGAILQLVDLHTACDERLFALHIAAWQRRHPDLVPDGVIGERTWAKMEPTTRVCTPSAIINPRFFLPEPPGAWPGGFHHTTANSNMQLPARGFMFVLTEVLPNVGERHLVRKIAVAPFSFRQTFSLSAPNPAGTLSPAQHALELNKSISQWMSTSNRPLGSPTLEKSALVRPRGHTAVLVDMEALRRAGATIVSEAELIADLQRFAASNPGGSGTVRTLIDTIRRFEGETLIAAPENAPVLRGTRVSPVHNAYVEAAEDLWEGLLDKKLTRDQVEEGLAALAQKYRGSQALGRVGRVVSVLGVIFTVTDLAVASHQSLEQQSLRPLQAEAVRQVGGWAGALAGMKIGGAGGAALGLGTGPGAIITGAIGALVFGALGYFGADFLADRISPN